MIDFENLSDKEHKRILKAVNGALKSCINTHGPISENWIGSAGKRVMGALKSYAQSKAPPEEVRE
jgi:hypothetical protein